LFSNRQRDVGLAFSGPPSNLIFARVSISGETVQHTAPERPALEDLVSNIHALLRANPLVCYLCGGTMQIKPENRLFQPSPDRIDNSLGSYARRIHGSRISRAILERMRSDRATAYSENLVPDASFLEKPVELASAILSFCQSQAAQFSRCSAD
jgi:hypothetical protein